MPREYSRSTRVAAQLQRLLNELLQSEVKDPRLEGVRVSDVELSGDLGVAKIYYGTLQPDEDPEPVRQAFGAARGFLRSRIGRVLRLRRVPELRFLHDDSARRGLDLSRLIDEVGHDDDD
jgi:ribosome-binding factor A